MNWYSIWEWKTCIPQLEGDCREILGLAFRIPLIVGLGLEFEIPLIMGFGWINNFPYFKIDLVPYFLANSLLYISCKYEYEIYKNFSLRFFPFQFTVLVSAI